MKLRPYQAQCHDAFYGYYNAGNRGNTLMVLPTAAGKSIILGSLITDIISKWPDQRILLLSHVAELISQNHSKILLCNPNAPAGIYSAGLSKRQAHFPVVTASIQSVYQKAYMLGHRDIVFIDEVHLLQPGMEGMYGELIKDLQEINPNIIICGTTATDYRTQSGLLTEGENPLFTKVIIEVPILYLLEEGYLTPPISKSSIVQADMIGVKITAGDYNKKEMAARFDQKEFLNAALDNDMPLFADRKCIAFFCATIENAEHVAEAMCLRGIHTETIDGEMSKEMRDDKFARFRSGELRGLASVGVMTTGTDIVSIDCIVMLIATKSPGKYQQIIGRGFRVLYADGYDIETKEGRVAAIANGRKPNFLVIDHGNNIMTHGPITSVAKPQSRKKGQRQATEKPKARICEVCRTANTLDALSCIICGTELKIERDPTANLSLQASDADIMGTPFSRGEVAQWFDVENTEYRRHTNSAGEESLRITYYSGILQFDEWKNIKFLRTWWSGVSTLPCPDNVQGAVKLQNAIKMPKRVQIIKRKKFYEVLRCQFNEAIQPDAISGAA